MKGVLLGGGVGLAAGFLSGLLGVGGGILMVPALVIFFHLTQKAAQATSLAVIVPAALAGCLQYQFLERNVHWTLAAGMAVGAIMGSLCLGVPLAHRLSDESLRKLFGVLLIIFGLRMTGLPQIAWARIASWLGS